MNDDYKRGYADAMNWKAQNHLEHLPPKAQPAQQSCYCSNCEELSKQVTALKLCVEVERGFNAQEQPAQQEPFGYFQYDIRLDAWVQNRVNNKGVAFYIKEQK